MPSNSYAAATISSQWDEHHCAGLGEAELLLYRSHLLGRDLRITNFGGGNTSAKIRQPDPLSGQNVDVLWVKGSGGDLGSMGLDGFATLRMDQLQALKGRYRGLAHEDEMVGLLPHCTFNLNPRAASIDTPLHAFIGHPHVDHMHPDSVIAIAACADGERLTLEIFGDELAWVPWQRPGFDLGLKLEALLRERPALRGLVLQNHGLITWGDSARGCYENTVRTIARAEAWLQGHSDRPAFGGAVRHPLDPERRLHLVQQLAPVLRGRISQGPAHKLAHFDDSPAVLEFVCSAQLESLAALGTSCPDHFLRTKVLPLVLPLNPDDDALASTLASLDGLLERYRSHYAAYYQRCRHPHSPAMRDPNPVIYLIPGVGLLSFARDKATARIASEFYVNAIHVMREAQRADRYLALPEQEAFDIEYWLLEEAKLQRLPRPAPLTGRVAFITGGAGGIGRACAERLLQDGACVLLSDIDAQTLAETEATLSRRFGADHVAAVAADVTQEAAIEAAMQQAMNRFGGLDMVVSNAGIASSAPVTDTSLALWSRNLDVLATGYFLVARCAFRLWARQGLGGSLVFVGSKNGLAASAGAAAYCTAKAAEIHLARCLALEGAAHGIRVNVVNPDAVIQGSRIWNSDWKQARAAANHIASEDVEAFYRERSLLKRSVLPEDIAQGVSFFAGDLSAKSTGNILNIDAGNANAFTR
ncbi:MAG: bifunctional rhamnulose-1-phosphate aldolase/short-chain dehydrogenase [Curvibacter sp.]|nr:bifunctional rhamnulose-1-phosphate aldolase/short-chain dehydrogenase [Curvibacter sp.]